MGALNNPKAQAKETFEKIVTLSSELELPGGWPLGVCLLSSEGPLQHPQGCVWGN